MSGNVFGFSQTNMALVLRRCREALPRGGIQALTGREQVLGGRSCYVVLGVSTLDSARLAELNRQSGVAVIVDALPSLLRVDGLRLLDADASSPYWVRGRQARFAPLLRALAAESRPLGLAVSPDSTLARMAEVARERGVLGGVLAAARTMTPEWRLALNRGVAELMSGAVSLRRLRGRLDRSGASGRGYEAMMDALGGPVARRLSAALREHLGGRDAVDAAAAHDVEPSEVRFLAAQLRPRVKVVRPISRDVAAGRDG